MALFGERSRAILRASASLAAKAPVTLPWIGPVPPASLNALTICSSGLVLIVPSPLAAASFAAFGALAATRIGGGESGASYSFSCSTV